MKFLAKLRECRHFNGQITRIINGSLNIPSVEFENPACPVMFCDSGSLDVPGFLGGGPGVSALAGSVALAALVHVAERVVGAFCHALSAGQNAAAAILTVHFTGSPARVGDEGDSAASALRPGQV